MKIPELYALNFPVPFVRNEHYSYKPETIENSIEQVIFEKLLPPLAISQETFVDFFTKTVRKGSGCRNAWVNAAMLLQQGYHLESDDEVGIGELLRRDGFIGDAHHNGACNSSVTGQVVEKTKRIKHLLKRKMARREREWKKFGETRFVDRAFGIMSGALSNVQEEQMQNFDTLGGMSFELHSLYRKVDDQNVLTVWVIPSSDETVYSVSRLGVEPTSAFQLCRVAHFQVEDKEGKILLFLLNPLE